MREISARQITETVARLCQEANYFLGEDVLRAIKAGRASEESPVGREVLDQILANAEIAASEQVPLCQDTGVTVIFLELGQDAHVVGGDLMAAINAGVRRGYDAGYLRKSMVWPPIFGRVNTRDNTPAIVHTEVVSGDRLLVTVLPKGAGSENMSRLFMLTPSAGPEGVQQVVLQAVSEAGPNPCPPIIVGVGIGGTAEHAGYLAKRALLREVGAPSSEPQVAALESELLAKVGDLGIGPSGFGGRATALAVHVEMAPCHIASLPVAVNIQCHSARHKTALL
ncbi:MAG: fumarate hydratase [Chloroflexota bacterium]